MAGGGEMRASRERELFCLVSIISSVGLEAQNLSTKKKCGLQRWPHGEQIRAGAGVGDVFEPQRRKLAVRGKHEAWPYLH